MVITKNVISNKFFLLLLNMYSHISYKLRPLTFIMNHGCRDVLDTIFVQCSLAIQGKLNSSLSKIHHIFSILMVAVVRLTLCHASFHFLYKFLSKRILFKDAIKTHILVCFWHCLYCVFSMV